MSNIKLVLPSLLFSLALFSSCAQNQNTEELVTDENNPIGPEEKEHQYGGWFCPDNLGGFPPMDIQAIDEIMVVSDRLPTKEETSNGTSLMYFDPEEYPNAKPLNLSLPRVASIYSQHNGMNELVIVIQAVVIGRDSVVGFRYPSGGNGTSWLKDVRFLSESETSNLGPNPMVYLKSDIQADKNEIWKAFTATDYAQLLGEKFNKKDFFESEWSDQSEAHLALEKDGVKASGIITIWWGNLYLHIDYDYNGQHYTEKMLLIEKEDQSTELHMVAGPYLENFESEQTVWQAWLEDLKLKSEKL